MMQLPKSIAFFLLVVVTILLAVSFSNMNLDICNGQSSIEGIFKELRETIMFLLLTIYFTNFYTKPAVPPAPRALPPWVPHL